ncbi:ABC transporter permease [Candidatus Saccharibacteria bacterium]|nr:ABC transporter permease [Candidatus Saccharibacteria bacterium]
MAVSSIRNNKTRSLLTMVGIIIGVSSVIMTVSVSEGLRRHIVEANQANNPDLVSVRPGSLARRDDDGNITDINYLASLGVGSLSEKDYQSIKNSEQVKAVSPLSTLSGLPYDYDGSTYEEAQVIAVSEDLPELLGQAVAYGSFFSNGSGKNSVVIGKRVAEELYGENVPLGKLINIRNNDFVVGGVFDEFKTNPLSSVTDLNKAVFISYDTARSITDIEPFIYQILFLSNDPAQVDGLIDDIQISLLANHGNQEDFTILKSSEVDLVARSTIGVATSFVVVVAGIALLVGGIGIMNIMFVSVTERTREIGVRKSLGATNHEIYSQFMVEATLLSVLGGIFGVVVAMSGNVVISILTDLVPVITWRAVGVTVGVSAGIGIVFGTVPAIKAARKDPIESLRYE